MAAKDIDFTKLTVLVVDDQEYIRKLICQLLKRLGCLEVIEAGEGSEALALIARSTPDLILCDIKMAPMDGLSFLQKVRSGEGGRDPQVPIVFLTSDSERGTVLAAIQGEVDGYMVKPVSPSDLKSKIIAVLSKRIAAKGLPWS